MILWYIPIEFVYYIIHDIIATIVVVNLKSRVFDVPSFKIVIGRGLLFSLCMKNKLSCLYWNVL